MSDVEPVGAAYARLLALALPDAQEGAHFGKVDFRVAGKIFATLPGQDKLVVKLTTDQQAMLCDAEAGTFSAVPDAWGRKGWTAAWLDRCTEDLLRHALTLAWGGVAGKRRMAAMRRDGAVSSRSERFFPGKP